MPELVYSDLWKVVEDNATGGKWWKVRRRMMKGVKRRWRLKVVKGVRRWKVVEDGEEEV